MLSRQNFVPHLHCRVYSIFLPSSESKNVPLSKNGEDMLLIEFNMGNKSEKTSPDLSAIPFMVLFLPLFETHGRRESLHRLQNALTFCALMFGMFSPQTRLIAIAAISLS